MLSEEAAICTEPHRLLSQGHNKEPVGQIFKVFLGENLLEDYYPAGLDRPGQFLENTGH